MSFRACIIAVLLATPALSQVDANGTDANTNPQDQSRMLTPPPVNGQAYPTTPVSEVRSNYLRAGLTFNTAYNDNVFGGVTANAVSDVSYSIWPNLALDETTPRLHSVLTYSPGFTFYQRYTDRNEMDQNVGLDLQYRLSPHVTASVHDSFQKSSNVFNQPNLLSEGVYGSPQAPTLAVIPPVADLLRNTAKAELTYQFSATGMIGVSGTFTNLHYPDPTEVPGLYDSSTRGGSAFYSYRLSRKHYVGAMYQYSRILAYPVGATSETQTHAVLAFYTIYLKPNLSLSLSGGPQHYDTAQAAVPASQSWTPAAAASLGWQGHHTTFAASYSRIVNGGGGLIGAFHSNSANASARWQIARTWIVGSGANYAIYKTLTPFFFLGNPGGHTVSGTVYLQHQLSEHFNAELGYTRLHQSFSGITVISANPDTNREYISISYQFSRPLGR
ncbi:MAG TPA: hypothetical protein VEG68_04110 [Terriglobales bacterium]|nr:hypothetical protein [Terriglobales bacterium]